MSLVKKANKLDKSDMMLSGNLSKVIVTLSIPIMLNNLIQTLYSLIDAYWVGKVGDVQFAATTLVWPVLYLIISIGAGINIAGTALISQYAGAGNDKYANKVAGQAFSFSMILAVLLAILGLITTGPIVRVMGASGALYTNSTIFLGIMYLDVPSTFAMYIFSSIRQSQGDTMSPMILSVSAAVLNMILDPVLIFVFKFGIAGAAFATVISKLIFTSYGVYVLFAKKQGIYIKKSNLKLEQEILSKIIKIGLPSSIGQSLEALGFLVLNIFIVSYGSNTLSAFGIGNRINSIIMMPALGIGASLTAIAGQNIGANKLDRAKEAFRKSLLISVIILLIGGIALYPFSRNVVAVFSSNKDVINQGTDYLKLIAITGPLMGIFQVCMGIFQGSGHTIYSMSMAMARLWLIRLPMIVILKNFTDWGPSTVWFAMISSNVIICIAGIMIYMSGKWEKQVIKKEAFSA